MTKPDHVPKKYDNRCKSALIHGKESQVIAQLQQRLDLLPLKATDKMEFERWIDAINTQNLALDIDTQIKSHLIDALQSTDKRLMSYIADLGHTQMRLANIEKDLNFHKAVLDDLKTRYLEAIEDKDKKSIYEQIQEAEKTVTMFENRVKDYLELRNKIRREIDKGNYQDKQLQLKEEEMRKNGDRAIPVDFTVMDEVE